MTCTKSGQIRRGGTCWSRQLGSEGQVLGIAIGSLASSLAGVAGGSVAPFSGTPSAAADTAGAVGPAAGAGGWGAAAGSAAGTTKSVLPHRVHGLPSGAGPTPASVHQAAAQQTQNAAQERHLGVCGTLQCSHRSHRRRSAFVSPLPSPRGRRLRAGGGVSASNHADGVPSTAYTRG